MKRTILSTAATTSDAGQQSRTKLLDAAMHVIRLKGYAGTTVDDICLAAGVTKGSFFHHFKSKDALAVAAVEHFSTMAERLFAEAPYRARPDPLARLLGYVDFRASILGGPLPQFTCLMGTLVQETYDTHPEIRQACDRGMSTHVAALVADVTLARRLYAPRASWTPESVGYFIQSVLQGAFIFAKAKQGPQVARDSLAHLRRYLLALFRPARRSSPVRKRVARRTLSSPAGTAGAAGRAGARTGHSMSRKKKESP